MEAKHTPGLWEARGVRTDWIAIGPVGKMDLVAEVCTGSGWVDNAQANARLIAAAPEMYEALALYFRQRESSGDGAEGHFKDMARAALSKATGK